MANSLSSYAGNGAAGDNSVTAAVAARFKERYDDADNTCREAVAERNRLRAEIKAAGIPLPSWDAFRKDSQKSGEVREREDVWRRRLLIWDLKPTGYQAAADFTTSNPDMADLNAVELQRIDREGIAAGKAGQRRDSNNYTPGTEAFQRWDEAWVRGDAEHEEPQRAASPAGARRPRGRPARATQVAERNEEAFAMGKLDGLAGHMDHAARWPAGEPGHADYGLGHREAEIERADAAAPPAEGDAPPKRGRGRPRKDAADPAPARPRRSRAAKPAEPGLLDQGEGAGETV
jgi:hypothetical protein